MVARSMSMADENRAKLSELIDQVEEINGLLSALRRLYDAIKYNGLAMGMDESNIDAVREVVMLALESMNDTDKMRERNTLIRQGLGIWLDKQ